jgi:hypothetical protein
MSTSISSSLLSIFKSGTSADDLLKSTEIIKKMMIGISYLDNKNPKSVMRLIFGDEVSHASLFFFMGEKKNSKTGVLVQYGKYEYIKNKKEVLGQDVKAIGYPYKEKGGLIFGEIEYNTYKKEFCTIAIIKPKITYHQITLSKFLEDVVKNKTWDYQSYSVIHQNCKDFVAEAIRVINPVYNKELIDINDNSFLEGKEDEEIIPKVILNQLKKNAEY